MITRRGFIRGAAAVAAVPLALKVAAEPEPPKERSIKKQYVAQCPGWGELDITIYDKDDMHL